MLQAVRDDAKRESLSSGFCLHGGFPVSEHSGQVNYFSYPATIFFLLDFYAKVHSFTQ